MAKALYEVIGVKKGETSKGKDCFNYYLATDFTDYDMNTAECEGRSVLTEFSYTDFNVHVGDFVELDYIKGFQDRATLSDMTVIKSPWEEKQKAEAGKTGQASASAGSK